MQGCRHGNQCLWRHELPSNLKVSFSILNGYPISSIAVQNGHYATTMSMFHQFWTQKSLSPSPQSVAKSINTPSWNTSHSFFACFFLFFCSFFVPSFRCPFDVINA